MGTETIRNGFEAYIKAQYPTYLKHFLIRSDEDSQKYHYVIVQEKWQDWQAACLYSKYMECVSEIGE